MRERGSGSLRWCWANLQNLCFQTDEILKGASSALENARWMVSLGERPSTSVISFPQKIAALSADSEFCFPLIQPSVSKNFLLHCANSSISYSASRKLHGFHYAVSLESTKLELLREGNKKSPSTQSKGKLCTNEPAMDHGCELAHTALVEHSEPAKISDTSEQMDLTGETSLSSAPRLVDGKVQTVIKKKKKGRSKKNNCGITVAPEVRASERVSTSHYATVTSPEEAANLSCSSYTSVVERASDTSTGIEKLQSNSSYLEHIQHVDEMIKHQETALQGESVICTVDFEGLTTSVLVMEINKALQEKDMNRQELGNTCKAETKSIAPEKLKKDNELKEKPPIYLEKEISNLYVTAHASSLGWPSYEWPSIGPTHFQSVNGQHLPAATDRLHLDVGHNWHNHFHQSFVPAMPQDLADESKSLWVSEEEFEVHPVCGMDYNQYFGGGVTYWNPSDYPSTGFSRSPSLSSDYSSWAWHEAEMSRAIDDMVAFSSSYNTSGLTSPPATPFCSPFDSLQWKILSQKRKVLDPWQLPADAEGKTGDSLPYPISRPIIAPSSRSDFKHGHDHKSRCVPPARREYPRIKRPQSPVMLCVPWVPRPRPRPPSPVGDSRKHRGFPTVRSGCSSPRHWGSERLIS
ncbi:hypothetical protein RJ641_016224 [Dillenia turbinata]|uniref:Uncharacterized protein n=1 Tax=Dillenia turbinata TaxID=194707 RepID=A0AAN8UQY8_9MAGN